MLNVVMPSVIRLSVESLSICGLVTLTLSMRQSEVFCVDKFHPHKNYLALVLKMS
jgi:hypothetical protein